MKVPKKAEPGDYFRLHLKVEEIRVGGHADNCGERSR